MNQSKTKKTNFTLVIILVAVLGLSFFIFKKQNKKKDAMSTNLVFDSVDITTIRKIDLNFNETTIALRKNAEEWIVAEYNSKPTLDNRANQSLVDHIFTLLKSLKKGSNTNYNVKEVTSYGIEKPELSLTFEWEDTSKLERHHGAIFFGNRDLSQKKIFAFIPQLSLSSKAELVEVSSIIVDLIKQNKPLDLRNRKVVTFDADDIEELQVMGKCGNLDLTRNGDHWEVKRSAKPNILPVSRTRDIHLLLKEVLESKYDSILEERKISIDLDRPARNFFYKDMYCMLHLLGIRNRNEVLFIYEKQNKLYSVNTLLPAEYALEEGYRTKLTKLFKSL